MSAYLLTVPPYPTQVKTRGKSKKKAYIALKRIVPLCHPKRVEREIECLKILDGKHNVVPVSKATLLTLPQYVPDAGTGALQAGPRACCVRSTVVKMLRAGII